MKPTLILLVCPALFIVSITAQSQRFAQPLRRRKIDQIETTDIEEETIEAQNYADAEQNIEVKRLIDIMKAVKHKSKKKKVLGFDKSVSKQMHDGIGQVRREPVINGQHSVQKIRNRGRQIPTTRISDSQQAGRSRKPHLGKDTTSKLVSSQSKKFRIKEKTKKLVVSESGEHTYPTERIIIRVQKSELDNTDTLIVNTDKFIQEGKFEKKKSKEQGNLNIKETDRTNSLSFLTTFLKSYEKNSATTTQIPKVTILSKQERDSLLNNMLNSKHRLASDITKKIDDMNLVDNEKNIQNLRMENERSGGIQGARNPNQAKRLRKPVGFTTEEETQNPRKENERSGGVQGGRNTNQAKRLRKPVGSTTEENTQNPRKENERNGGVQGVRNTKQAKRLRNPVGLTRDSSGRKGGLRRPSSKQIQEQAVEISTTTTQEPVFRSNKQTINNIYNIIEQVEHVQSDKLRKSEDTISKESPIQSMNNERLDITAQPKLVVETITNPQLEINPSNLFLSTFMGFQRTKRPQIATSRINSEVKEAGTKYPFKHRFSPGDDKPEIKLDGSKEERPSQEDVSEILQTRPVNQAFPNIKGRNSLFSRHRFSSIRSTEKTEVDSIKTEVLKDENTQNNEIEKVQIKKVSEPRARFGFSTRGRPRNLFNSPKSDRTIKIENQASSTVTSNIDEITFKEALDQANGRGMNRQSESNSNVESNARYTIHNKQRKETNEPKLKPVTSNLDENTFKEAVNQANSKGRNRQSESNLNVQSKAKFTIHKKQRTDTNEHQLKSPDILDSTRNPQQSFESERILIKTEQQDKELLLHSRTTQPNKKTKGEVEKSSTAHLSRAGLGIRTRGRSRTVQNHLELDTTTVSSPVFLPTRRPAQAQKRTNFSETARHGQGRPASSDNTERIEEEKNDDRHRHSVQGRGRSRDTVRETFNSKTDSNNKELQEKQDNEEEDYSSQLPPKRINYSKITRHGQERPARIKEEQNDDKYKKTSFSQGRHSVGGRGRSRDRAREEKPINSRTDTNNNELEGKHKNVEEDYSSQLPSRKSVQGRGRYRDKAKEENPLNSRTDSNRKELQGKHENGEEDYSSQLPSRTRVSVPGTRRSRPSPTLTNIGAGPRTSSISDTSSTSEATGNSHDNRERYSTTDSSQAKNYKVEDTTRPSSQLFTAPVGRWTGIFTKPGQNEHDSETVGGEIGKQTQNNESDSTNNKIDEEKEKLQTSTQSRQRGRSSLLRNHGEVESSDVPKLYKEEDQIQARTESQLRGRSRGSLARKQGEAKSSDVPREKDDSRRYHQRERVSSTVHQVENTEHEIKSNPSQRSRSRARSRPNLSTKNAEKSFVNQNREVSTIPTLRPQVIENERQFITKYTERPELQEALITTTYMPELREIISTENIEKEKSLLTFDPFATSAPLNIVLKYNFFPADSDHSKENFKLHLLNKPDIETESEDLSAADLSEHLSSALDLATVTWTQDPYRGEVEEDEGRAVFDIDFSKNPNNQ